VLFVSDPGYGSTGDIEHLRYFKEKIEPAISNEDGIILDR
jgi:hypothetical protein